MRMRKVNIYIYSLNDDHIANRIEIEIDSDRNMIYIFTFSNIIIPTHTYI